MFALLFCVNKNKKDIVYFRFSLWMRISSRGRRRVTEKSEPNISMDSKALYDNQCYEWSRGKTENDLFFAECKLNCKFSPKNDLEV